MTKILEIRSGSHLYNTTLESSNEDRLILWVEKWNDLVKNRKREWKVGPWHFCEIGEFVNKLLIGDFEYHKLLWAEEDSYIHYDRVFEMFKSMRNDVIHKPIALKWIFEAERLYKMSIRLGEVVVAPMELEDFISIMPLGFFMAHPLSLRWCLSKGTFDPNSTMTRDINPKMLGMSKLDGWDDIHFLHEYLKENEEERKVHGIANAEGDIIDYKLVSTSHSGHVFKGLARYDSKKHTRYKTIKNHLNSTCEVLQGYDTKRMYLSMYMLCNIINFVKTKTLTITVYDHDMIMRIRRGLIPKDEVINHFNEKLNQAKWLVNTHIDTIQLDHSLFTDTIKKIRDGIK